MHSCELSLNSRIFTKLEPICCCSQTCIFVYFMLLMVDMCVVSFIVQNASMTQLQACDCPHQMYWPKLFVVVYQKRDCLDKNKYYQSRRFTKYYNCAKFHGCISLILVFELCEFNLKKKNNKKNNKMKNGWYTFF